MAKVRRLGAAATPLELTAMAIQSPALQRRGRSMAPTMGDPQPRTSARTKVGRPLVECRRPEGKKSRGRAPPPRVRWQLRRMRARPEARNSWQSVVATVKRKCWWRRVWLLEAIDQMVLVIRVEPSGAANPLVIVVPEFHRFNTSRACARVRVWKVWCGREKADKETSITEPGSSGAAGPR